MAIYRDDDWRGRAEKIQRLQEHLQEMYERKKEVDEEVLHLSQFIDCLVVEEVKKRTKIR